MKRRLRRLRWGLAVLAVGILLLCFTPLSLGRGGTACGPNVGDLYRFVQDTVSIWRGQDGLAVYSFGVACRQHDNCYARAAEPRRNCDNTFLTNMTAVCDEGQQGYSRRYCLLIARSFYDSVRVFGWVAYDSNAARRGP
ncbi:MAG: hypothetical protein AAF653_15345 [Chloroflexota bacterium]